MTKLEEALDRILPRWLSVEEAAAYVGISKHTLYTMTSQRRIPYTKVGRLNKFDRESLDAWLAKHTIKATSK